MAKTFPSRCSGIFHCFTGLHDGGSITGSPLAGRLVVVMGAGGAGKALAYGAKLKGARIVVANIEYGSLPTFLSFFLSSFLISSRIIICFYVMHMQYTVSSATFCFIL